MIHRLLLLCALVVATSVAYGETIISGLSSERVAINSSFSGTEIVVFGTIERDRSTVSRSANYELAVVLKGPPVDVVTRRKERTFGIWINRDSRAFLSVPSFYAVHASAPLDEIASDHVLRAQQLGVDNIVVPVRAASDQNTGDNPDFINAYLRLKTQSTLFQDKTGNVEFLSADLFKTTFNVPARVPTGDYTIDVLLFRDGALLAFDQQTLNVSKVGLEQLVYDVSQTRGFAFGLIAVIMALFVGWLGGVVFKRD